MAALQRSGPRQRQAEALAALAREPIGVDTDAAQAARRQLHERGEGRHVAARATEATHHARPYEGRPAGRCRTATGT